MSVYMCVCVCMCFEGERSMMEQAKPPLSQTQFQYGTCQYFICSGVKNAALFKQTQ